MRYFVIDTIASEECETLYEYNTKEEFEEEVLENRTVAKECGDKVETLKDVRKDLKSEQPCSFEFNAMIFVKGEELLEDYGFCKGEDY